MSVLLLLVVSVDLMPAGCVGLVGMGQVPAPLSPELVESEVGLEACWKSHPR